MDNIQQAEATIGEHDDANDWEIQPKDFVSKLQELGADDLANVLTDSLLSEKAKRYTQADEEALSYQLRFKQRAKTISNSIFIGAMVTALISVMAAFNIDQNDGWLFTLQEYSSLALGILALLASGAVIYNNNMLSQLRLYEQWMDYRAQAETARLAYFKQAAKILTIEHGDNLKMLHQYCSFFRRYQLQVQQAYYNGRSKKHEKSFKTTAKLGAFAAVIVGVFAGTAGIAGFTDADLIKFAALGAIGVALSALASRREAINQDERNIRRYKITAQVLSSIAEKYSSVQKSLASGKDPKILVHFVDAVHEQLSLEHRQWTQEAGEINNAFNVLIADQTKEP